MTISSLLASATPSTTSGSSGGSGGGGGTGLEGGTGAEDESFTSATDTAVAAVEDLVEGFVASIPSFLVGLVVLAVFWAIGWAVGRVLRPRLESLRGSSVAHVMTTIATGLIKFIGVLVFLAVAFPAVDVGTLVGAGGVIALAAGFAFQDIFENLMAGLLLLYRQPFEEGDVIEVNDVEGIVDVITIRETRIRRFDRQVVVVPNADVYKNAIRIQTADPAVRSSLIVGVSYADDLERAEQVALEALATVDGVEEDPAPEALYVEFGGSSINLDLRYFHGSTQAELRRVQGEVVKAVKKAFDAEGIDIPFPITTLDATDDVAEAMRAIAGRTNATPSGDAA